MAVLACVSILSAQTNYSSASGPAFVIHIDENEELVVVEFDGEKFSLPADQSGLAIWIEGDRDRWLTFSGDWLRPHTSSPRSDNLQIGTGSRGGQHSPTSTQLVQLTTLVTQLRTPPINKGAGSILTPYDEATLLRGQVTFRRDFGDGELPSSVASVFRGKSLVLKVPFSKGATKVVWSDIPDLGDLKEGLPVGTYRLEIEAATGVERIRFKIAPPETEKTLLDRAHRLGELLKNHSHPLVVQVAAEELLLQEEPHLADALDILETLKKQDLTPYLASLKSHVLQRLSDPTATHRFRQESDDLTGDSLIDEIRSLIAQSRWDEATEELNAILEDADASNRQRGLAYLYRGVIHGESGATKDADARTDFRNAIDFLSDQKSDLLRAQNNFANFLLGRALDRLHNHAMQMAAGVSHPLLSTLQDLNEARKNYEAAEESSDAHDASLVLNLGQTDLVLADLIRTLQNSETNGDILVKLEMAARARAVRAIDETLKQEGSGLETVEAGIARELLSQAAFRANNMSRYREHADAAKKHYEEAGSLVGLESFFRMEGLAVEEDQFLRLQLSNVLSEILQGRYPTDASGQSIAGFMSRRYHVNERIVDLLATRGDAKEALQFAERAKARAFSDLLSIATSSSPEVDDVNIDAIVGKWPDDVTALEYYLTANNCWLFVITADGMVRVEQLRTSDGEAIAPRVLIEMVRNAREMLNDYKYRWQDEAFVRRFDNSWQHQLHELYSILIPTAVAKRLSETQRLVIVPHHILHYFPFAALVTAVDDKADKSHMAIPRYLLDHPFSVSYAPSLATWHLLNSLVPTPISRVGIVADTRPESGLREVATEVRAIQAAFGNRILAVYDGQQATTANAKSILKDADLAFFGCHGQNVWDAPLKGHLLLQDDNLSANSLLEADINASGVILSACHSGLADRSPLPGDDLFGLERALLSRGVQFVVSGNWLVDDLRGARITSALTSKLAEGVAVDRALTEAQRLVVERYRSSSDDRLKFFSHPHFWAVYKLSGVYPQSRSAEDAARSEEKTDTSDRREQPLPVVKSSKSVDDAATEKPKEFSAPARDSRVRIQNNAKGYNVVFEIDDQRHRLAPAASAWYQISPQGSTLSIVGGSEFNWEKQWPWDVSRQSLKGGGAKQALSSQHRYAIVSIIDRPGAISERLRSLDIRNLGSEHKQTNNTIWIENPYLYSIHYSLNNQSFSLKARHTRWHKEAEKRNFRIEFDSSFDKGYQRQGYRLRPGSRNYFKEVQNGLDLFRH